MNLINGFRIVCPIPECGAIIYAILKNGNKHPIRIISAACSTMFFRLKPGKPSYQIDANNCCTLGCATNCNQKKMKIIIKY